MRKTENGLVYSATDLVNFLECGHITTLDLRNIETPLEKGDDDEQAQLLQERGLDHEQAYLRELEQRFPGVARLEGSQGSLDDVFKQTVAAMQSGASVIYQGALWDGALAGYSDFLVRVEHPSRLGAYSYEVEDTKLARSPKAKFLIQLCFYSSLLARIQGVVPERMHVVLGDGTRVSYRVADYLRYYENAKSRFLERVANASVQTSPDRCAKCSECRWSHLCEAQWEKDDHLNQVANIRNSQIRKLSEAGIRTLAELAELPAGRVLPGIAPETLENLRHQAELQCRARQDGKGIVELLPLPGTETHRGLARLPEPDPGDLYFDMEGDPLAEGGLEYLFGIGPMEGGDLQFHAFWAHSRMEEKQAFESFMDFVAAHLRAHPKAHIYHYAAYEETALKRLMSLHGTREREVDDLLRQQKLVDLYKVVREGIRVSEPRYSIKNIEHFYMGAREGDVQNAGASIVRVHDDGVSREHSRDTKSGTMITAHLMKEIRSQFRLDWHGIHGVAHWARVRHHGVTLARAERADVRIPVLFSVIHDSQRRDDGFDPEHGLRAAEYAAWLRGRGLIELDDHAFHLLQWACQAHSDGLQESDTSVQVCWDADRLDLGRVGIYPDIRLLCTKAACQPKVIEQAWRWSLGRCRRATPM